jgi:hypothetical protein
MCEHFSKKDNRQFGSYELSSETLAEFGLNPIPKVDEDDNFYGQHHCESVCFEAIYLEEKGAPQQNANMQLMKRKKGRLAAIAQNNIIIPLPPTPKPEA